MGVQVDISGCLFTCVNSLDDRIVSVSLIHVAYGGGFHSDREEKGKG